MKESLDINNSSINLVLPENKSINLLEIHSKYILKHIFSLIDEKNILKLIMYNKNYQEKFEINIENYKKKSKIYKIAEKNGKGKEFHSYNNKLIFEGEYLNGKRNGKGKEYFYDNVLSFEGEYLNGKKWKGKGKEKRNNEIIFEGEYINGKRWIGKGKEYYEYRNRQLKFEGEYLNGERNGKGKEYDINGKLIYEGEYLNNKIKKKKIKYIIDFLFY